ncbi:hypothetical protein J2X76_005097 [Neorhizobium sp. 2083]|nr:hypothetical protein [Neorhizobium sp. 2083]MDR6819900.1 hypothetical protein [Neorhizobium sp. 2083]
MPITHAFETIDRGGLDIVSYQASAAAVSINLATGSPLVLLPKTNSQRSK